MASFFYSKSLNFLYHANCSPSIHYLGLLSWNFVAKIGNWGVLSNQRSNFYRVFCLEDWLSIVWANGSYLFRIFHKRLEDHTIIIDWLLSLLPEIQFFEHIFDHRSSKTLSFLTFCSTIQTALVCIRAKVICYLDSAEGYLQVWLKLLEIQAVGWFYSLTASFKLHRWLSSVCSWGFRLILSWLVLIVGGSIMTDPSLLLFFLVFLVQFLG